MILPEISGEPAVQQRYEEMRLAGESHNIAKMCALRSPPRIMTDSVYMGMDGCNHNQFADDEVTGHYYKKVADAHGVDVAGRKYLSGLAAFPGDPRAWIKGRGEIKSLMEERGWECTGAVETRMRMPDEAPPPEGHHVDPRLIESEVELRQEVGDTMGCRDAAELTEKLTTLRIGHSPIPEPE